MKWNYEKAMEYIKGYCTKHIGCKEGCKFYDDESDTCIIQSSVPADWELKNKGGHK